MSVSSESFPSVTVIIPTRNGAETLRELLAMLRQQTIELNDIHVVDSDSSDDTLDVARQFEAKITSIKASDFDHGGTRSESAAATEGMLFSFSPRMRFRHPGIVLRNFCTRFQKMNRLPSVMVDSCRVLMLIIMLVGFDISIIRLNHRSGVLMTETHTD